MSEDQGTITSVVVADLRGPDGEVKARCETSNLVTAVGDQFYAGRAALSTGLPAAVTGMKLGASSTATAKTGAGAALVTYLAGSNKALDSGFPTAAGGVVTWKRTYAAGEATTASAIQEAVLVTTAIATDATSTAADTIARVLLTGIASKGAGDSLTITWTHTVAGA